MSVSELEAEAALVAAAQANPTRFGELYRRHVTTVHALAWGRLGDRAGAEDATAETFRRALRSLPRYEPRGVPFRAWLMRICANAVNDELRRRQRAGRFADALPDTAAMAVDDDIEHVETRAVVHRLVERLSPDHRVVLALRFGEDLSIAAVADRLDRSPDAIKQLQRRALAELRALINDDDRDEDEGDHDA